MTRNQSLINHLIKGGKLSIMNGYKYFGISNIAREVGRLIEKPLGIELKREWRTSKTKYGTVCHWLEYSATRSVMHKMKKHLKTVK